MKQFFKKGITIVLATLMLLTAAPLAEFSGLDLPMFEIDAFNKEASAATSGYYTYSVSNGKATINDVSTNISGAVTVPSTLGGYPVTTIGDEAFYNCTLITSVTIPAGVTSIKYSMGMWGNDDYGFYMYFSAFDGCTSLNEITVDENNTHYCSENGILYNKDKTTLLIYPTGKTSHSFTIPDSVMSIGYCAFSDCTSLTSVTIPRSVTSIGDDAFSGCTSLTAVTIPDSVTSIGSNAFYRCSSLTSITIPDSVTSIGQLAFSGCTSLTSITISDSATSIGDSAFSSTAYYNDISNWDDNVLYIGNHLIKAKTGISGAYTVKDDTKTIANSAFSYCSSLTSVTIPDSVKSIGQRAFYKCDNLADVYYVGTQKEWNNIFIDSGNSAPTSATIHYNYCLHTETEILSAVPATCTATGLTEGKKCTKCGEIVTKQTVIPMHFMENDVCTVCGFVRLLASGTCGENLAWELNALGTLTISGSGDMENYDASDAPWYSKQSFVKKVVIEDGVTNISDCAFSVCTSLTSVTIADSVKNIGFAAFSYCTSLTSVTIPDSVTSIGDYAFSDCAALTSVTIPDSVTHLGYYAFDNTAYYNDAGNWENSVLYIGKHLIQAKTSISGAYSIRTGTKTIAGAAFRFCSSLTSVTIPDGVTSIGRDAFSDCSSLTSITIPDSVTSIGEWVFSACSSLTSVTIPNSVTSIGREAFSGCSSLTSVTIPNSVTSIGREAFSDCSSLTSITIPDSVTSIGVDAFSGCSSLISVTLSDSVKSIGNGTFARCSSLTSITIPDSVTSIGDVVFSDCSSLIFVTIPNSVTSIGEWAFAGCSSLISVTIPDGVTSIGNSAFSYCTSLTSVTIPDSVTSIGDFTFSGCSSLISVTIPKSVTSIGGAAFENCSALTSITILSTNCSITDSEFTIPKTATIYGYANSTAQVYAETYDRFFVVLEEENAEFTESEDAIITETGNICALVGKTAETLLLQAGDGATLVDKDEKKLSGEDKVGTGAVLTLADGTQHTLIIQGDTDGNGEVTASDARFALRYSVNLETIPADSVFVLACEVDGEENVSASDARSILRASVKLDDPADWLSKIK